MTEMMFDTPATCMYFRISFMNEAFHFIVTVYIGMKISFCEKLELPIPPFNNTNLNLHVAIRCLDEND